MRIFVGTSASSRYYFIEPSSTTVLFPGVNNMILDLCSQMVDGTTTRETTKDGNYDILNFLMFTGGGGVYQNTDRKCTIKIFRSLSFCERHRENKPLKSISL